MFKFIVILQLYCAVYGQIAPPIVNKTAIAPAIAPPPIAVAEDCSEDEVPCFYEELGDYCCDRDEAPICCNYELNKCCSLEYPICGYDGYCYRLPDKADATKLERIYDQANVNEVH